MNISLSLLAYPDCSVIPSDGAIKRCLRLLRMAMSAIVAADTDKKRAEERERRFMETINLYDDIVRRICFSFASRGKDFDDLRQDALINIWNGLDKFRGDSDLRTWVYRVTFNTCVSTYRRSAKTSDFASLESAAGLSDSDPGSLEAAGYLHALISSLNSIDRSIIIMWLDDYSYDEIADVTGLNRNTVATRIRRARESMKALSTKRNF